MPPLQLKRPWSAAAPITPLLAALGFFGAIKLREFRIKANNDDARVLKHYIMTHPEKFLEPERKKFGDACVVIPWEPNRN
jgi:hypothetical protein